MNDLRGRVAKFGFTVQGVAGYDDDDPEWAYTVGLWRTYGAPDLCLFGLDAEDMMGWLNDAAERVAKGLRPAAGDTVDGIIDGFSLHVKPVDPGWHEGLFGQALHFSEEPEPTPMLQLIWPDRNGRLPWDEGARARCREWQPRLWLPVAEHTIGPWRTIATETG